LIDQTIFLEMEKKLKKECGDQDLQTALEDTEAKLQKAQVYN
jgi:hypothetical protein